MVRMLTKSDVAELLKVSAKTVERRVKDGTLPQPKTLGPRTFRWTLSDFAHLLKPQEAANVSK